MERELRASLDSLAEETEPEVIPPDFDGRKQLPALIAPACCERWPSCTCRRDSKILSLSNSPLADAFERPQVWDSVLLPGGCYSVMHVYSDGRIAVAVTIKDPFDADYATISLERWQDLCLRDDARLMDGSAIRKKYRPLASE